MKLAYLVNQYPKVSHSFIRREITALETRGFAIARFSIRKCTEGLVDEKDKQEAQLTRVILGNGFLHLFTAVLRILISDPMRLVKILCLALKMGYRSDRGMLRHLAYAAEACLLRQWVVKGGIEHIHAHFGTNSAAVAMFCRMLGGPPYSFTVHGPEEFDKAEFLSLGEKIERAKFVIAISEFTRSQLYRWCSHDHWSKVHIVHCGVDETFLSHPRISIPSEPRLVCIGRLCEQKGQLLLVEAARRLAAKGLRFKIKLIGDGPMRGDLIALIQTLRLENSIEIVGWMSGNQVREEILRSRAMVLSSFAEGLPVVIMEALALGRPVIGTNVGGIAELIETGINGWLIPAGSVDALTSAMQEALEAPVEKLDQMGKVGAARIVEEHSSAKEAAKLIQLFKKSINNK